MKKIILITCLAFALAGCKTEISKETSVSELQTPYHEITAQLAVEVASCGSYEDSNKPSQNLLETQEKIPNLFKGAKYKQCYQKELNSFAEFEITMGLGKIKDSTTATHDLYIFNNDRYLLGLGSSDSFAKAVEKFKEDSFMTDLDISIAINIKNDTDADVNFFTSHVFIENTPAPNIKGTIAPGKALTFKASDVATATLTSPERIYANTWLLTYIE